MTDESEPTREYHALLFAARRSVRYHMYRQRFLDRIADWGKAATAVSGSATVATLIAESQWAQYTAIATAIFAALDVVFAPSRVARHHNEIARDFIGLEQNALRAGSALSQDELLKLQTQRLDIEAKEPPIYRVLDAICNDELVRALGHPDEYRSNVTWFQRALKNIVDVQAHKIRRLS